MGRIADDSEAELKKSGKGIGSKVADGVDGELERRGKGFAESVERGVRSKVVKVKVATKYDKEGNFIGRTITQEIARALDSPATKSVFNKIGLGIADAVGSGFNVSGRSPLIAILIPAIFALVGVFTALAQAINAAVAVLLIVPGLLASIGLQAGVLMLAFDGLGAAVQGAFAAKNTKELDEALKGLTPSARNFVKELLPLKDFFRTLKATTQERFFAQLQGIMTTLRTSLGPTVLKGFASLATSMGKVFRELGLMLGSPVFRMFLSKLFPATQRWLEALGSSLFGKRGLLTSILAMATALMPFMERFGQLVLLNFDRLAGLLFQLSSSPATRKWLDDMATTLQLVFDLLFNVGESIFFLLKSLNDAGGQNLLTTLSEAFMQLSGFLASPVGKQALEGLVDLGIAGIKSFIGLVEALLLVLAAAESIGEFFNNDFFPLIGKILETIGRFVVFIATFLGVWIERIFRAVGSAVTGFFKRVSEIPGQIRRFFDGLGSLLIRSGRSLIQGLIDGVRQKLGELWGMLSGIAGRIGGFFGLSPAKEGPLSGRGYIKFRGQHLMQDLVEGIRSEVPSLRKTMTNATSNIVFGANSIQMQFTGPVPDQSQARSVGAAMGLSAAGMIASRNTQLAVRTI